MIGKRGERLTIGCPEQEMVKQRIQQEIWEDKKIGATARHGEEQR